MLKLKEQPKPTFKATVEIQIPGGKSEKIRVEFRYHTQKQFEEFIAENPERSIRDSLLALIVAWDGVDLPFDEEAFELLCDQYPGAPGALWLAYQQERHGARTKN